MLKHIVFFKLKEYDAQVCKDICEGFRSMKGKVAVLREVEAGYDVLRSGRSYDIALTCTFDDAQALEEYQRDPEHLKVAEYVSSVSAESHSVDYVIPKEYAVIALKDGRKMTVELMRDAAPLSVENFVDLARSGFYEGLIFHRVIRDFMVQGGGMDADMKSKRAPRTVKGEFAANGVNNPIKHVTGVISMARTQVPDSASSQFFICVNDTPYLDGQYAAFGKCADDESVRVAIDISKVKTGRSGMHSDVPQEPIVIDRVEIFEK